MSKEELKKTIEEFFEFIDNGEDVFKGKTVKSHPGLYFFHSKEEFDRELSKLINEKDYYDVYDLYYITSKLIKFLLSKYDSHTKLTFMNGKIIPLELKVQGKNVYIINNSPEMENFIGAKVISINDVNVEILLSQIEEITCYGTIGYLNFSQENILRNSHLLRSLPSIDNNTDKIKYKILHNGEIEEIIFDINNLPKECIITLPKNYSYEVIDEIIVVHYNSCQSSDKMENLIEKLKELTNMYGYNNFIIDIRDNLGGDSSIIWPLIEFLKDKNVVTLVNEKVFSSGRMAFVDLKNIGSYSIGTDICTPLNCFGFNRTKRYTNLGLKLYASTVYWYYNESLDCKGFTKENFQEYFNNRKNLLEPIYLHPDEYVELTIEDIINNNDTMLNRALQYIKESKNNKR